VSGIVVLNLYPRQLGINGDVGNVLAVAQRATWRGMPLTVVDHDLGEPLPPTVHFVHVGAAAGSRRPAQDCGGFARVGR
jgi:CobQ-like glutamine amidotransferase family enzyme